MKTVSRWLVVLLLAVVPASVVSAELKLMFPQNRTTFQTNERIDVSIVRAGEGALPPGNVTLVLADAKSTMTFVFGLKAGDGSATDHLHVNGWLLKPGAYTLTATMGGESDKRDIAVFSHIRKSPYRTIHWGGPGGDEMAGYGENAFGFNLMLGGVEEMSIREGMDIMGLMAMGGMHQHDGNLDCDWSDPCTYIGAIQRAMDRGQSFRTMPNMVGLHLHDEPGLTHYKHPVLKNDNGDALLCAHDIPAQRNAYLRAFDKEQPWVQDIDTKKPADLAAWTQVNDFKLGYMEAFWRASRDAVERLKPGALAVTQTVYGWPSTYDGYYFNIARSMPIVSGHGGYAHFGLWNFNPSYFLEMAMPRQLDKPTWYLPGWGEYTNAQVRQEQYLSFITGIQGLAQPPMVRLKSPGFEAIKETNQVAQRLGTIFAKPAFTRQDVTMLFSKSNVFYCHLGPNRQFEATCEVYAAAKLLQVPISVILEEDILDGTLAASHKAVMIAGVDYLDPAVVDALADFAKTGGLVLVSDDVPVAIPGATKLGMEVVGYGTAVYRPAMAGKTTREAMEAELAKGELDHFNARLAYARPIAKKLGEALAAKKILPPFASSVDTIAAGYQVRGEIEYTLAVNFTSAPQADRVKDGGMAEPIAASATITLPNSGRPVYEAMSGKDMTAGFAKGNGGVSAKIDFGPGDMKIFARPIRAIGGVQVATPVVSVDLTREGQPPIQMNFAATIVDKENKIISGTAPLQIVVKDPAGNVRYDLFRATDAGTCAVTLPLAANDAAGKWTVTVTDLLAGTKGESSFEFQPLTRARSLAGATHRAVFFGDDKVNIYRFFRDHRVVTIAVGESDYNQAAAERLAKALKPYNITATIVKAKDVLARELSAEEARTWCGTGIAGRAQVGRGNNPATVGWDLPHPVIVLGTPEDNVMLGHLVQPNRTLLPYRPSATFPGKGNGMVAWNIQSLGHDVQALACVAYDAEGMSQAIGTLFELGVGLDPLLPLALPSSAVIEVK